jgi:signal transduction histidine kinase
MQHIGREIHDNIGQKLTLASLYTQQLAYENKAPNVKDSIENISDIINQSLTELRELSKSLTDNTIDSNDIYRLIERECAKVNKLRITNVTFTSNAKNLKLDYKKKSVLLRIVQEFLQNSVKHALCQNIQVSLEHKEEKLILSLKDDGKGFDSSKIITNGIGLINIKKRTEILGGTFSIESKENQGTKVNIEISL